MTCMINVTVAVDVYVEYSVIAFHSYVTLLMNSTNNSSLGSLPRLLVAFIIRVIE